MFPPERIVCLTEETVETLYLLGEERRIVGVSGYAVRPARVRREKPRVSAFISAAIDKILALEPDLVLAFSDLQADIAAALIRRNVAVHAFNQRDIAGIFAMIETLGALTAAAERAGALVGDLRRHLAAAGNRERPRSPRVYFAEWGGPMSPGAAWVSVLSTPSGGGGRDRGLPASRRRQERQGPHRDAAGGDCRQPRHHHRLVVRQEVRAGQGRGAAGLRRHPGGTQRLPARDQVAADPAAGARRVDRRARRAGAHHRRLGGPGRLQSFPRPPPP